MMRTMDLDSLLNTAKLPSPAPVVLALYERLEHGSAEDIAQLVEADPAIAARLLRLANSAFYGRSRVASIRDAVIRVGTVDVAALVLATEVMQLFRGIPTERWNLQQFWEHSLLTACYSQTLAPPAIQARGTPVWLCGLLHDIGRLLLVRHCPSEYAQVLAQTDAGATLLEAEQATFGHSHAAVGAALLQAWEVPGDLAVCAARHHEPYAGTDAVWSIVAAANDLANEEKGIGGRLDMTADEVTEVHKAAGALYAGYRQLFREQLR